MPQNCRKKKHHKKKHDKNNNTASSQHEHKSTEDTQSDDDDVPETSKTKNALPYEIKHSDIMGRYLVSARSLKAGELIIQEDPLAVGPCADSEPICLGCYQPVELDGSQYTCPECKWPMCDSSCPGLKKEHGHSTWECALFRDKDVPKMIAECKGKEIRLLYEAILTLRILLNKKENPEKWKKIMEMEAHNDIRKKIPSLWVRNQEVIVRRIKKSWDINDFLDDEIHTACGILEVNSFEIGQNGAKARAIYPSAFLLSHECCPNTTHTDDPNTHAMSIRVTRPLKAGEPITLSYAYTFQGTLKRREHLQEGKFFWCQCPRCEDPTELGTYSSAMRCPKCQNGIILSTEPLNQKAPWKCKSCEYSVNAQSMFLLLEKVFKDLDSIDPHDVEGQEDFLQRYRNVLTKNHYLNISAKYSLCQLYGRGDGYLIHELSEDDLKRKEEYCRDVLSIVDVLEPGMSRLRGVIMYELHAPIMLLATRQFESKQINNNELRRRLREVVKLLRDSHQILILEPKGTNENSMAIAAKDALRRIGNV